MHFLPTEVLYAWLGSVLVVRVLGLRCSTFVVVVVVDSLLDSCFPSRDYLSTALAPSSTFAPAVSVASPAKLQAAAAALAEVANGIEGEVSVGLKRPSG